VTSNNINNETHEEV